MESGSAPVAVRCSACHTSAVEQLRFQWDIIEAMVGGASAIDLPALRVETAEHAEDFLRSYGFDIRAPNQRLELEWVRSRSVAFIEEQLLDGLPELCLPESVRYETDVTRIMLAASSPIRDLEQRWSCALLRVMHTVSHARLQLQERFGDQVKDQILGQFESHFVEDGQGIRLGKGHDAIPVHRFDVKHAKPLESVVLKLLHKPENVAADIFDHLGIRFVTYDRLDVLLVARYLRQHIISFPNIKPSRSKNSLLDMDWVRREFEAIDEEYPDASSSERLAVMRARVGSAPYPVGGGPMNPHSAFEYHAVQFTCRHYVRVDDPFGTGKELSFFFPYEVQIIDKASFEDSHSGRAAHQEYKARQRESVRRRVLGPVLDAYGLA